MNKNNDYEVKKMYYCKFDCPLKKKLPEYIREEVESEIDCIEGNDDMGTTDANFYIKDYEFEFTDDICRDMCPLNDFLRQLGK